jgi:isopentenyl-diphosphate delta-isomerase
MEVRDQLGVKRAAVRKMEQELGITADQLPIDKFQYLTRILYKAPSDGIWGEHEIDYILIIRQNVTFTPNPNEVKDTKYVSQEELKQFLEEADKNEVPVTPWFRLIVNNFLYNWWDNIDNLESMKNDTIHKMV